MKKTRYVRGFMFSDDWLRVLLIRKLKPKWQFGLLNGIGGHIEKGESEAEAMVREFKEETGVQTTKDEWKQTVILFGQTWSVYFYRACGDIDSAVNAAPDEGDVRQVPLRLLGNYDHLTISNLAWIIPMQLDNIQFPVMVHDLGGIEKEKLGKDLLK